MLSGAANLAGFAGPAIISNVLKGGDVITVAALTPMNIPLVATVSIDKPEELRGKNRHQPAGRRAARRVSIDLGTIRQ